LGWQTCLPLLAQETEDAADAVEGIGRIGWCKVVAVVINQLGHVLPLG
jgi:hypothetical protein